MDAHRPRSRFDRPAPRRLRTVLWLVALTTVWVAAAAQTRVTEVLEVHNRPAAELVPLIAPVLAPGERVQADGPRLVLHIAPQRREEIRRLVADLDTPPRRLVIAVRGTPPDSAPRAHLWSTAPRAPRTGPRERRVQAIEGSPALIELGTRVPEGEYRIRYEDGTPRVAESVRYRPRTRRLLVTAWVLDGQVRLAVDEARELEAPEQGGATGLARTATTLQGPLGQWLEVAGEAAVPQPGTLRTAPRRPATRLWIRVDLAP